MNGFGRGEDKEKKSKAAIITRETAGMTLLLFSAVLFFITVTGRYVFGDVGTAITAFFVGTFGFLTYPLLLLVVYLSIVLTFGKKWIPAKWLVRGGLLVLAVFFIVHTATSIRFTGNGYGAYLAGCWDSAKETAANGTGGGVLLGLIVYPVASLLRPAGAYVLFSVFIALALFYIAMGTPLKYFIKRGAKPKREKEQTRSIPASAVKTEGTRAYPAAVGFEDIDAPAVRPLPADARETARPVSSAPAAVSKSGEYDRSREILFQTDPATSYRKNLIFDHDSYFNSHPRRSSVQRETPAPAPREESTQTYSERFSREAQETRAAMPRRITESRPQEDSGYTYPAAEDLSYTNIPSYRAQAKPAAEAEKDYYANDVPVEQNFYENDVPQAEEEEREEFALPEETAEEPAEPAPAAQAAPDRDAQFRSLFSRAETPALPAEPAPQTSAERDAQFRSLFSRPAASETSARREIEPARREIEPARRSFEETPVRRSFGEEEEPEEDAPQEESRVYDALPERGRSNAFLFDDDDDDNDASYDEPQEAPAPRAPRAFAERRREAPAQEIPSAPVPAPKKHVYKEYIRPDYSLFRHYDDAVAVSQEEVERNSAIIVDTLAGFRVDAEVVKVTSGSAVTRYDIDIPRNVTVRVVIKHDQEIAMRLHARDGVNIYSNSEVGAISIEVPNSVRATVGLKSVLQAEEYQNSKPTALMFALGKDVEGRNVCGNIVKMKHILVAGSTGSGKSVCLNAMLISLICKYSPQDLRLILIDPKKVEFAIYDGLPHLMINEIIADAQKAVSALNWSIKEMERRYLLFEQKTRAGRLVHNVDEYNANLIDGEEKLPKIVVVVDELADLMLIAKKDIEDRIQRLAQKARAAGIHLIIATQRPSVDVITGVIKGNLPTRIAFRVIQEVDSRTIIDSSGAEKLLGNGDMLYRTEGMFNCSRVQGAFLSSEEVQAVVNNIKENNEAYFDESIADYINKTGGEEGTGGADESVDGGEVDPQYIKALGIVVKLGSASISLIQRKCSVGYNHAGKIIEWMELMGYITPFDGKAKARTVLLTQEEFEEKYGSID